jgi:hypothetical protein
MHSRSRDSRFGIGQTAGEIVIPPFPDWLWSPSPFSTNLRVKNLVVCRGMRLCSRYRLGPRNKYLLRQPPTRPVIFQVFGSHPAWGVGV